jgi:vancomycin resistance protein YoaR
VERILGAPRPSARLTRRMLAVAGIGAVTATAVGAAIPARYIDRVYPGTTVLGQDLAGMTANEAVVQVQQRVQGALDALVTFRLDSQEWVASADDLGVKVDWPQLATQVIGHGREDAAARAVSLMPWSGAATIPLPVSLDHAVLNLFLARLDSDVSVKAVNATLDGTGPSITIIPDVSGRHVDLGQAREIVVSAARTLEPRAVDVPLIDVTADITVAQLAATKDKVLRLSEKPITLKADGDSWTIASDDLTRGLVMPDDVLTQDPSLDPWWIGQLVDPIVAALLKPATDAVLGWDGGLYAMTESAKGQMVDHDALVDQVIAAADTDDREVRIAIQPVDPRIDSDKLGDLGITALLTTGDSSFSGSSEARATNVGRAAYWVSQTAIAPGEVFSFNDSLGAITEDRGYVTGKIISGDWFADDIGGGVCQVSTTVYRAALYAGFPFGEWHPHSARVAFYELDGWPIGVDAAIYQVDPSEGYPLDLKFTNTTGSWILLQMVNTDASIIAQLYGSPTGWDIEIPAPLVGQPIAPPPPQTRTTNDLPKGQSRVMQKAQAGVDVELYRTVTAADGTILSYDPFDTFKSYYAPLPQITEVGA